MFETISKACEEMSKGRDEASGLEKKHSWAAEIARTVMRQGWSDQ